MLCWKDGMAFYPKALGTFSSTAWNIFAISLSQIEPQWCKRADPASCRKAVYYEHRWFRILQGLLADAVITNMDTD